MAHGTCFSACRKSKASNFPLAAAYINCSLQRPLCSRFIGVFLGSEKNFLLLLLGLLMARNLRQSEVDGVNAYALSLLYRGNYRPSEMCLQNFQFISKLGAGAKLKQVQSTTLGCRRIRYELSY